MPKTKTTVTETTKYEYGIRGSEWRLVTRVKTTVTESEYPSPYATYATGGLVTTDPEIVKRSVILNNKVLD